MPARRMDESTRHRKAVIAILCRTGTATADEVAGRSVIFIRGDMRKRTEAVKRVLEELVRAGTVKYADKDTYFLPEDVRKRISSGDESVSAKRV